MVPLLLNKSGWPNKIPFFPVPSCEPRVTHHNVNRGKEERRMYCCIGAPWGMFVLADVFLVHILKSFCFFTDDDDDRSCTFREPLFWHLGLALTNLSLAIYVCYTARLQSLTMSKIIQQTWMKGQKFKGRTCFSFLFFREEFLIVVVVFKKRLRDNSRMREGTDS